MAPRNRLAGADSKPPSAAVDKSHGRERGRKRPGETGSGVRQEEDCKETTVEVSKPTSDDVKTADLSLPRDKAPTEPVYGRSGIRHERWPELAMRRIGGTWEPAITMLTEKPQVEAPRGRAYGCVIAGAGQRVVAMKSPIKGWSQGAVSRSLIRRANQQWEEPDE
jgi:hypothetical protein